MDIGQESAITLYQAEITCNFERKKGLALVSPGALW